MDAERVRRNHHEAIRELQHLIRQHVNPEKGLSLDQINEDVKDIGTDTNLVNDHKVAIDATDDDPGFLDDKLGASDGMTTFAFGGKVFVGLDDAGHDIAGDKHSSSTLAELNAKISDADLDDKSDSRTPKLHDLAGDEHGSDTLANLNAKITDADLDDKGDARTPKAHDLAGAKHNADTLANLNTKISDADVAAWEEGTWTPSVYIDGVLVAFGTGVFEGSGSYRRIGDQVQVWCELHASSFNDLSGETLAIGGIPYDAVFGSSFVGSLIIDESFYNIADSVPAAVIQSGTSAEGGDFGDVGKIQIADGMNIEKTWTVTLSDLDAVISLAYIADPNP